MPNRAFHLTAIALLAAFFSVLLKAEQVAADGGRETYDVVIYGGTSAGVVAAVQAARLGKSAVLIAPGSHVGGMTTGGLGATDIGNKAAIGGIAREFYRRVFQHYTRDDAWKHESRDAYLARSPRPLDDSMWTFEPHIAEAILREMLQEVSVPVVFGERLDLENGVEKHGARIAAITMESGRRFAATMFVDATYEGDLLAGAGVSYTVGREANAQYDETLNGVQKARAVYHQFIKAVDPYVRLGDPTSGLLWGIQPEPPGEDGTGDRGVQAYCFRMCQTDVPENRIAWQKPPDYDEAQYELLLRNFEAGDHRLPMHMVRMPNRKTDTNNNFAFSTDNIGRNYGWPEGDYAARERIFRDHLHYQQGLMWTLANHPRVPADIRETVSTWGLCRDEFTDTDGWPHQLYVREARRMVSDYVMTQHNCQGRVAAEHSIGLAA